MTVKLSYADICTLHDCLIIGAGWREMRLSEGGPHAEELERTKAITAKIETLLHESDLFTVDYELSEIRREVRDENTRNKRHHGVS